MKDVYTLDLTAKTILITGGYGHLGAGIVKSLLAHQARVYVLARSAEKFKETFKTYNGDKLLFQLCDISKANSIRSAIQTILAKEKKIDVFINNAFYLSGQSAEEMEDKDFSYGLEGCLASAHKCIKSLIPQLKKQQFGKIINVASMYGMVAPEFSIYEDSPKFLNPPHYGAAKAGLIQLTKYYASYLGKDNIQVNAVSPGPFPSPAVQKDLKFVEQLKNKTALKRIGKPADLGGIFVLLSSDASNYITGQNLVVDGGWTSV